MGGGASQNFNASTGGVGNAIHTAIAAAAPPLPPTPESDANNITAAEDAQRKARGAAANILTGGQGVQGAAPVSRRMLLGS